MLYKDLKDSASTFALDIGTRSVMGVLGKRENDKIKVEHIVMEHHEKRVMYNGQIHDIDGVTEIVRKVRAELEERSGHTLDEVSIAVAGRSLKTNKVTIERDIDPTKNIDKDIISSLEVEGLQEAQYELEKQSEGYTKYFCVGHTVIHYYINDDIITSPIGHKANKIRVDILATFLPQIVVDSLYAVTSKLNLEISFMTLEPIAAIEIAVPENARLLNLALVDIGAGTSDIAITKDGTVVAYGMTSKAGDDITEEIAQNYLLDFDSAEKLKISLCSEKVQRFSDIVGIPYEIESEEILSKIEGIIKEVAKLIGTNILEQNGKSPSAVFLIGGGSQIPNLSSFIADELNIPKERVVVRGIETIINTVLPNTHISGPEYITPIGILAKATNNQELDFIEIFINQQRYKLFQTKELKVKDGLVLAGFNPRNLVPKRGKSTNIIFNGIVKTLFGQYGEGAKILINGNEGNIESNIKHGDVIKVYPAEEGKAAQYLLKDIIPLENKIMGSDNNTLQKAQYSINDELASGDELLREGDRIKIEKSTIQDNHVRTEKDIEQQIEQQIERIEQNIESNITETEEITDYKDMKPKEKIMVICNDNSIEILKKDRAIIFVDIFDYIDFDRSKVKGKLVLLLNQRDANYTDVLKTGDEIKIYWEI